MADTIEHDDFTLITRSGLPHWLHTPTGRVLPFVSGGDGPEGEDDGGGGGDGGDPPKTFTQAELDKLAGRRAAEAKKAAAKEIADQLGVTVDQAKKIIADAQAADDAKKTDTDRALEAAKAAQAEAEQARADAARERFAAKVERRLTAAGVPEAALARAARLITVDPDADDDALAADIDALKADLPALFQPAANDDSSAGGKPKPPPSTGAKPPAGGTGTKTAKDLAREELRRRGHLQNADN